MLSKGTGQITMMFFKYIFYYESNTLRYMNEP